MYKDETRERGTEDRGGEAYGQADTKGYDFNYNEIWHTEKDTYDKSIPEYQNQTSVVTDVVVYGLANLDNLLSRNGLYRTEAPMTGSE